MLTSRFVRSVFLVEKYWCLFCGQDGPRWDTCKELFRHMETTIHRTSDGGLVIPRGKVTD